MTPAARALTKVVGTRAALDLAAAMAGAEVVEADEVVGCNSLTIGRSTSKTEPWLRSSVKKCGPSSRQPQRIGSWAVMIVAATQHEALLDPHLVAKAAPLLR